MPDPPPVPEQVAVVTEPTQPKPEQAIPLPANEPEKTANLPDPRIVAIEAEALALGWTHAQLWGDGPFPPSQGLVMVLKPKQTIAAVSPSAIRLEETNSQGEVVVKHFYNPNVPQPWVMSEKLLHS